MPKLPRIVLFFITSLFSLSVISVPAFAEVTTSRTAQHTPGQTTMNADTAKQRLCQRREKTVDGIITRIANRGQKHIDLYTDIAKRVEAYYTKSGKTLNNYNSLVAAVNSQKANAQQAVDTLKDTKAVFKCDGGSPSGAAKAAVQAEIQAVKDYRTAVKNLVAGVKSVPSAKSSTGGSQ